MVLLFWFGLVGNVFVGGELCVVDLLRGWYNIPFPVFWVGGCC